MNKHTCKAKRIDNGEWIEGQLIITSTWYQTEKVEHLILIENPHHHINDFCEDVFVADNCFVVVEDTVCRYSGLKDKIGVEIFEGDIVHWYSKSAHRRGKYQVFWQPKKCGFELKQTEWPYDVKGMQIGKHLKVTGNIHD